MFEHVPSNCCRWVFGGAAALVTSSEVRVCPDRNDLMHRERLMKECPPAIDVWNEGLEVEIRPGGDVPFVLAFTAVCLRGHAAIEEAQK